MQALQTKVTFDKDGMHVSDLSIRDEEIVSFFREFAESPQVDEKVERILRLGVLAAKTIGVAEKVDYIEKEFQKLDSKFKETFSEVTKFMDEKLEDTFGEEGMFSGLLQDHFGEEGTIVKDLFNPNKDGSPLCELKNHFENRLKDLEVRLGVKQQVDEVRSHTTQKGYDFEDFCESVIGKIARINGDMLERIGTKSGTVRASKKGDFIVTLGNGSGRKIVIEVKDGAKYSLPEIQRTLETSISNREASYGIFIVKEVTALPASVGWFTECGRNQLVCALSNDQKTASDLSSDDYGMHEELLYIAYKWAKSKVLLESAKDGVMIDVSTLSTRVQSVKKNIDDLKSIAVHCGNIEKSASDIRTALRTAQNKINDELEVILHSLKSEE
jgi:hypothetical protein